MSLDAMVWVLRHSEATLGSRLVLLALADYAHSDGTNAFPSIETIVLHSRMTRRAVQSALRKLEEEGHIEAAGKRPSGTTVYTLRGVDATPRVVDAPRGVVDAPRGVVDAPRGVVDAAQSASTTPEPVKNRQDPIENKEASIAEVRVDGKPIGVNLAAKAQAVMDLFNVRAGSTLTLVGKTNRARQCIVMRLREHPELSLADHEQIIGGQFVKPWWTGTAGPEVIYGNATLFEKAMSARRPSSDWAGDAILERTRARNADILNPKEATAA